MNTKLPSSVRTYYLSISRNEHMRNLFNYFLSKGHLPYTFILVTVGVITHHNWFSNLSIMTYGDWIVDYIERIAEFKSSPQAWSSNAMGSIDIGGVFWPLLYFNGLLANFNINTGLLERIFFLWPVALLTPICMYYLCYYILKSKIGAFTSAVAYTYSTPLIVMSTGILTAHMAMTLTPLLLLTFLISLEKESFLYSAFTSIIIFIIGIYDFRFLYLDVLILFIYTIFHFLIFKTNKNKINKKIIFIFAQLLIVPFLLNLYWLPNLYQPNFGGEILNRSLFGSAFVNVTQSIFLFVYLWSGSAIAAFVVQPINFLFLSIPFFVVLGIYFSNGKNKYILYFSIISLIGIFFTKMDDEPFSEIYNWFFINFPGFNAFRDSTKFYFYIALGYAVLIGAFVKYLTVMSQLDYWKKFIRIILIILINGIFLWNTKPLINGEIGTIYVQREVPNDYLVLKKFLQRQNEFYRTLYIPRESRWAYYANKAPKLSNINLINASWGAFANSEQDIAKGMLSIMQQDFSANLLNVSSIKYVIVPIRDVISDDDFFIYYGNSRLQYIQALSNLSYLEKIDIGTNELVIFENKNFKPHIYVTPEIESMRNSVEYSKVDYECIQPTQCEIKLKNVKDSIFVNFSDNYHDGWTLFAGHLKWNKLSPTEKEISKNFHKRNDASLNSFYLDIDYFKNNFPNDYLYNSDGTINLVITLYFKPQDKIKVGALITIITFNFLLIYIFIKFVKNVNSRKNRFLNSTKNFF